MLIRIDGQEKIVFRGQHRREHCLDDGVIRGHQPVIGGVPVELEHKLEDRTGAHAQDAMTKAATLLGHAGGNGGGRSDGKTAADDTLDFHVA